MTRLGLAMRVFFRVLRDAAFARQVQQIMKGKVEAAVVTREEKPVTAARSGALSLLEALQREARFVDFMKESLGDYSNAQVGAAVRDVHRGCADAGADVCLAAGDGTGGRNERNAIGRVRCGQRAVDGERVGRAAV